MKTLRQQYMKGYNKAYNQRPYVKAKMKTWSETREQTPTRKAWKKAYSREYNQRPYVRAKWKETYQRNRQYHLNYAKKKRLKQAQTKQLHQPKQKKGRTPLQTRDVQSNHVTHIHSFSTQAQPLTQKAHNAPNTRSAVTTFQMHAPIKI